MVGWVVGWVGGCWLYRHALGLPTYMYSWDVEGAILSMRGVLLVNDVYIRVSMFLSVVIALI